jgi:hypothetical protein
MATLPRTARSSTSASDAFSSRRQSEFDAGINTSTAWTEHLERASLSDEDPDDDSVNEDDESRPARALYDFEGKPEFRELSVQAGDEIGVLKEQLADGWSLVKNEAGEVGLLPRTYYAVSDLLLESRHCRLTSPISRHPFSLPCISRMHPTSRYHHSVRRGSKNLLVQPPLADHPSSSKKHCPSYRKQQENGAAHFRVSDRVS